MLLKHSFQSCRFACREEIYSSASEQPESAPVTPEAKADVRSLLGSIPCPVFCPLDYSNNSAKVLQVHKLCLLLLGASKFCSKALLNLMHSVL